ncbi:MAG: Na+/H+ antiporter NhaC family protein [Clostridia bacterium]|nr:Na+/H+ antiporter NhaC family protein [Clostridia bacterium]
MKENKRFLSIFVSLLLAAMVLAGTLSSGGLSGGMEGLGPEGLGRQLGPITLIPPLLTVVLAFLTKEVITALVAGSVSGILLLTAAQGGIGNFGRLLVSVLREFCGIVVDQLSARENAAIVILCLVIGGLVAIIRVAGGFQALAHRLTKHVNTPRKAQLMAGIMGMIVFFDDYANSLIVGPVMRPITDGVGVSREKLAFLVDSTAAPVAGIAIISSWIAAELAAIASGFAIAGVEASPYSLFLASIPFCFYNIFCLAFIFIGTLSGREYGPMYRAEVRARRGRPVPAGSPAMADPIAGEGEGKLWTSLLLAVGSVVFLCAYAIVGFYVTGRQEAMTLGLLATGARFSMETLRIAFSNADTVAILLEASVLTSLLALLIGVLTRSFSLIKGVDAWLAGAAELVFTAVILGLAWTLSEVISRIGTIYFLADLIVIGLPYWLLPTLVFITCCTISFAAGSYGCMLMMMPMVIPIVLAVLGNAGGAVRHPEQFMACCVASVLSGSIFGDHCSPVTDTTILSAQGAGCNLLDHVKTQMPYAITAAVVSVVCGTLPAAWGLSPLISFPVGAAFLWLALRVFGKRPSDDPALMQKG